LNQAIDNTLAAISFRTFLTP